MSKHDSDSWSRARGSSQKGQSPYEQMGAKSDDIDEGLKKLGEDMYFLNFNKYKLDPTNSKEKGYGFRYNLSAQKDF